MNSQDIFESQIAPGTHQFPPINSWCSNRNCSEKCREKSPMIRLLLKNHEFSMVSLKIPISTLLKSHSITLKSLFKHHVAEFFHHKLIIFHPLKGPLEEAPGLPCEVEKSIRLVFDASETFDVGMDLGAPVSLNYAERAPFKRPGRRQWNGGLLRIMGYSNIVVSWNGGTPIAG